MRTLQRLAPLALLGVWACYDAPVETPAPKTTQQTDVVVDQRVKNQVDLLFLVDNSPSMGPGQAQLKQQFPLLIKLLDDFAAQGKPAWYHIGVVTSDLGAGPFTLGTSPNKPPQCAPNGDGAKLVTIGAKAAAGCLAPTKGLHFIDYNQLDGSNNLPVGQDLAGTFSCMASVGDDGCGFEHQLEAVYRAVKDPPADNQGFFRPDAILAVVFVTNEDDCSAPPDGDLFDPAKTQYGVNGSYRCNNYGIICGNTMSPYADSGGTLANCRPATVAEGSKLIDVAKYINLFTQDARHGGAKDDPEDVILASIMAPATPYSSILASKTDVTGNYVKCSGPVSSSCSVVVDHSCTGSNGFYGDPPVRLNAVMQKVAGSVLTSVCDSSYKSAIEGLAERIVSKIGDGCITSPFRDPDHPDCVVEDVTTSGDGSQTVQEISSCAKSGGAKPCWKLELKDPTKCLPTCARPGEAGQHFGVTIDRGSAGPPTGNTKARVACATLAIPKDIDGMLPVCGSPL